MSDEALRKQPQGLVVLDPSVAPGDHLSTNAGKTMIRTSLPIAAFAFFTGVALGQSPEPVRPPPPPPVSLPAPSELSRPAPIADDMMTVGRPVPEVTPVAPQAPVVDRSSRPSVAPPPSRLAANALPPGTVLNGQARVLDGNTITLAGRVVVTHGADAPEQGQTCYDLTGTPWDCWGRSTARLSQIVASGETSCVVVEEAGEAIAATCRVNGDDIASIMVREGYSVVPDRLKALYGSEESSARSARRGLWSGQFDLPWRYRQSR